MCVAHVSPPLHEPLAVARVSGVPPLIGALDVRMLGSDKKESKNEADNL